ALAARLERDQRFAPTHRDLPDADLAALPQCLAQHDERLFGEVVRRYDVIRLFEVEHVDLAGVDELDEVERLAALNFGRLDLVVVEQDVVAFRHLVAFDDLVAVHGADALDDLLVVDPLAARLMDLVETDRRPALGGRIDLDRDRYEREADLPLPIGTCGHLCGSSSVRRSQRARGRAVPEERRTGAWFVSRCAPTAPAFHPTPAESANGRSW